MSAPFFICRPNADSPPVMGLLLQPKDPGKTGIQALSQGSRPSLSWQGLGTVPLTRNAEKSARPPTFVPTLPKA